MDSSSKQPWRNYDPIQPVDTYEGYGGIPKKPVQSLQSLTSLNSTYIGPQSDDIALIDQSNNDGPIRYPSPTLPQRHVGGLSRSWIPEIVSSAFSVASLISLIVVLRKYDGRGLDDLRLPSWLTINGLIALIATMNRVALVAPVEAAMSQEVWLWFSSPQQRVDCKSRLEDLVISDAASRGAWGSVILLWNGKGRYISYLGSLVVIVSLAFGAFTQQLITFQNFALPTDGPADLTPGNIPRSYEFSNFTGNPAEGYSSPLLNLKAAVYNGMLTENIAPITAYCPTGNCTWPVTPTVGVCGECQNHLEYKTVCDYSTCNYTLPGGDAFNFPNWTHSSYGLGFQVISSTPDLKGGKSKRLDIIHFSIFGAPYDTFAHQWANASTIVSDCVLWYCVQALQVETKTSTQTQSIVSTFHNMTYDFESGDWLFYFDALPPDVNPSPGANYSVGSFAAAAMEEFIAPLVNGTVILNLESQAPSSDFVQAIWNGTENLDAWIANLALSMTNVIRTSAPATNALYNGVAYRQGIKVRWLWLTLPAAMVLLSLLVLATVMVKTARSGVGAWKGSPLTLLFADVDPGIKSVAEAKGMEGLGVEERGVGKKRVILDTGRGAGGLVFRGVG